MISVKLKGGLGNQMFQYALGRVLSVKNNTKLILDTSFLDLNLKGIVKRSYDLDIFNIKADISKTKNIPILYRNYKNRVVLFFFYILKRFLKPKGLEKDFGFDDTLLKTRGDIYLDGYWQSYKYFDGHEDIIRKDFSFKDNLDQNIKTLSEEIKNTNSVCVHIRRGDYVGNPHHEVVDTGYYQRAVELLSKKTKIEKIYVFSDDIGWCRNNIVFSHPTMFVGEEYSGDKAEGHLFLMSSCNHFIIPNSSFSWWGAWLSVRAGKIVIAPNRWFPDRFINMDDIIPKDWIRID